MFSKVAGAFSRGKRRYSAARRLSSTVPPRCATGCRQLEGRLLRCRSARACIEQRSVLHSGPSGSGLPHEKPAFGSQNTRMLLSIQPRPCSPAITIRMVRGPVPATGRRPLFPRNGQLTPAERRSQIPAHSTEPAVVLLFLLPEVREWRSHTAPNRSY